MLAFGRLLRLSLFPSALADVAAGIVFATGAWPAGSAPWLLLAASAGIYHGGMVLNDWADRERDARTRPDRPLPSGAVPAPLALGVALLLLAAGPLFAFLVSPRLGFVAAGLTALVVLYDLGPRGAWLGPLLLGLCRAGNLSLGLVGGALALSLPLSCHLLLPPLAYGGYVFTVSRLARFEDAPDDIDPGRRPSHLLRVAAFLLLLAALVPTPVVFPLSAPLRLGGALLIAGSGATILLRRAARPGAWTREEICRATGAALRCLLLFTAALALASGSRAGLVVAPVILAGFPLSHALRRVFPPS